MQQLGNNLLRLPGGRSVSQGNKGHAIFFDQTMHLFLGVRNFGRRGRLRRVYHQRIQYLSGGIHHRQLAAGPEGRIPPEHHPACDGLLHQELLQILLEDRDRPVLRHFQRIAKEGGPA